MATLKGLGRFKTSGLSCFSDEGKDIIDLEEYKESTIPGRRWVFPAADSADEFAVFLFTNLAQIKPFANVTRPLLNKQKGGMRVGLKIVVGQSVAHNEGDRVLSDVAMTPRPFAFSK
ncbi:MAG: hypothetical protein JRL30_27575 [Deltaproteobacteria bacterium]|nr:hypothetical protein [Deltaproteobacteria bacterium]